MMEDSMRLGANGSREACSDVAVVVGIDRKTKVGNPFWARTPDERRRACAAFDGLLKVTVGLGTDGVFDAPEGAGERGRDREVMERLARQTQAAIDALAKNQATRPALQTSFSEEFPKEGINYTVQAGDTLSGIAKKYGAKLSDVRNANKIADDTRIRVGQTLFIPQGK